jgi:hypothetical protein
MAIQWILFMNSVNHSSSGGLVRGFQGNERMWKKESYMKLAEKKEARLLASGEKLSSCFLLVRMCGVCLEFHSNRLGIEIPLDSFFS